MNIADLDSVSNILTLLGVILSAETGVRPGMAPKSKIKPKLPDPPLNRLRILILGSTMDLIRMRKIECGKVSNLPKVIQNKRLSEFNNLLI